MPALRQRHDTGDQGAEREEEQEVGDGSRGPASRPAAARNPQSRGLFWVAAASTEGLGSSGDG